MKQLPSRHQEKLKTNIKDIAVWKKNYLKRFIRILEELEKEAEKKKKENLDSFTSWDWHYVRNYIDHDSPKEVFAPYAAGTLKLSSSYQTKVRIVFLDGTMKEMQTYLLNKARYIHHKRIKDQYPSITKSDRAEKDVVSQDEDPIERNLSLLYDYDVSIRRLAKLWSENVQKVSDIKANFAQISRRKLKTSPEFIETLVEISDRYGSKRNEADALNIARLRLAEKDGFLGSIVTGTNILLDKFPNYTVDPFFSLFSYLLKQEYPDPDDRLRHLNVWNSELRQLTYDCETVEASVTGLTEEINVDHVQALCDHLKIYKEDYELMPLVNLLSKAATMALGRIQRLRKKGSLMAVANRSPDFISRQVESRISHMLDDIIRIEPISLSKLGFSWHKVKENEKYTKLTLRRKKERKQVELLTLELTRNEKSEGTYCQYSIYWPVECTLHHFISTINNILNKKWVPRPNSVLFEVLLEDTDLRGFEISPKQKKWDLLQKIELGQMREAIRARVFVEKATVYYEPVDVLLEHNAVAAVVSNDEAFRWVSILFYETSIEYVPRMALKNSLRDKINQWKGKYKI